MTTDEKPNVVQLTYKEIFKINPLSTQFSSEENKRVLMNPAYRRLLLEIRPTDMKGPYEIVTCSIIRKEEVIDYICERFPEEKADEIFDLVLIQGFYVINNGVRTFMHTGLHWINAEGVCGTYGYDRDDIPEDVHKHMRIHTQDTFYSFMAIQHIMLNESDCFQVRKEYRKELKNDSKSRKLQVLDGELRETQTANYFSDVYPIDCTVSPANALFCRKNGTLLQAGNLL